MAEERVQRRLTAILAADVVGYSRLLEKNEAGTLAVLKERRRKILNPLVAEHHGRIVKVMGDGDLVEFGSAVNAVDCAVELQKRMLEQAIALDPELALAHSWLAVSYMVDWFDHGSREAFDHALILAERAVALDDDDGRCHSTLRYISLYHRQFERAEFHANRAIDAR
jgi:hypothetical protein